jgi:hypothetical protein
VHLQRTDALAVRNETTGDTNFARRATRFAAKRNGRKLHNDAFDQGVADPAKGFDAAPNLDFPNRLTNLAPAITILREYVGANSLFKEVGFRFGSKRDVYMRRPRAG